MRACLSLSLTVTKHGQLQEVTAHSLGIKIVNVADSSKPLFNVLIPKGTKLPAQANGTYSTSRDFQPSVEIMILEGESKYAKDNMLLDKYELSVKPAPKGTHVIHVTFSLDTYGALNVFMEDTGLKKQQSVRVGSLYYKPMSLEEWESEAKFLRSLFDETNRASVGYFPNSSEEEAGLGDFFFKKKDYTAALEHYEHAKKMEKDPHEIAKVEAKVRRFACLRLCFQCIVVTISLLCCFRSKRVSCSWKEEMGGQATSFEAQRYVSRDAMLLYVSVPVLRVLPPFLLLFFIISRPSCVDFFSLLLCAFCRYMNN
jgi:hypothetical protein